MRALLLALVLTGTVPATAQDDVWIAGATAEQQHLTILGLTMGIQVMHLAALFAGKQLFCQPEGVAITDDEIMRLVATELSGPQDTPSIALTAVKKLIETYPC
ncbi:MAG: hypothetical protein WEB63_11865 [Cucumibacter sp.]